MFEKYMKVGDLIQAVFADGSYFGTVKEIDNDKFALDLDHEHGVTAIFSFDKLESLKVGTGVRKNMAEAVSNRQERNGMFGMMQRAMMEATDN